MRAAATVARGVLGGYLAVHGAQKLFGAFGGHGLEVTGQGFESMGLSPGRQMATLAGVGEFAGGILTATGIADPLGPVAIASAMAVATTVHRKAGPMAASGGFELPLTYLAFAVFAASAGSGGHKIGPRLPNRLAAAVVVGAAAASALSIAKILQASRAQQPAEEASAGAG